ncbi:MAG TPA: histidine phosphatase family protein [Dehalococcoidia bacterium]|nr:histidine phosphatase family protein [Dehalococcoidia bacterium]
MGDGHASNGERETNEAAARASDERTARQRAPGAFDIAFLSNMENVTELLLIRHGQQEYDVNGPVSELLDPPLSDLGRTQARLVGEALSTERIDHVYASPLQRALLTGREVARHHRLEPIVVDDLREVGVFQDVPPDRTPLEYIGRLALAGARERMITEKSWDVYPFSESSHAFRRRVVNAIEGILLSHPNERVAVACHGGVINAYIGHVIGSRYDMFFRPGHTSINVVAGGNGRRALYRLNDTQHVLTAEGSFHSV